jgi:hypothetical protein
MILCNMTAIHLSPQMGLALVGHWTIESDKEEEGLFNEEYKFTVKGEKISKEIKDVRLEYDFGDGGENAKGSAAGRVS